MASRFKHRKPNPRLQQLTISTFSAKKIIVLSTVIVIGSALIYYYYKQHSMKQTEANEQLIDNNCNNNEHLVSVPFSSQSIYEKKISKFETRKEKLIIKNPRLRNEDDIKHDLREKKKEFELNKLKYSYFEKEENEYKELVILLTSKQIILKTQIIYHYIALLIKLFCGSNMCSILNKKTKIIHKYNNYNEEKQEFHLQRIQNILPIIKHKKWDSKMNTKLCFNTNLCKKDILWNNNFGIGVLSERAVNRNYRNMRSADYEIYPYFLNNQNEWIVFYKDIYFSTIYKDYIVQRDVYRRRHRRDIVDNSYRLTQNIIDAIIIINNKYGHISLFCTKSGIFMTDPRIKYYDIKKQWKSDIGDKKKEIIDTKVSNAIMHKIDMFLDKEIVKLFSCTNGNIYALYNNGILYELYWNDDNIDVDKKELNKIIKHIDDKQPNYKFERGHNNKNVGALLEDNDPQKAEIANFITDKFEEKCNEEIRKYNLIKIKKHLQFELNNNSIGNFLIYGIYFDEEMNILYLCQQKKSDISDWNLMVLAPDKNNKLYSEYNSKCKRFMETNSYLQNEVCYIMFVDETDVNNKQIIIILNQHIINIPLLTKNNIKDKQCKIYNLTKVIPDLFKSKACKWFYSYSKKSLYLFEKIASSSEFSYRFKRITIQTFRF